MSTTDMYKYITGEVYTATKIAQPIPGTGIVDIVGSDGVTPIAFSDIKLYDDAVGTTELVLDTDFTLQRLDSRLSGLEGVDVYRAVQIINVAYQADVFYADFDAVGGYAQYPPEIIYPIGATYTQYATEDSDDADTAMPTALTPTALFGGTWALLYDDEGIDFHTEGYDTVVHGRGQARQATGIARDEMQKITGTAKGDGFATNNVSSIAGTIGAITVGSVLADLTISAGGGDYRGVISFDSSDSPDAKTSDDTDGRTTDRNRWLRLWERTA